MDDMNHDVNNFEQFWDAPEEVQASQEKPALGPHRFKVKSSTFFEDTSKWSILLVNKEGASIWKKCHLGDQTKISKNREWVVALFDDRPAGKLSDFDWKSCEGKMVDATVGSFTPVDRDDPITFVNQPKQCPQPVETATVKRASADQKAKKAMSADMLNDVPF